MRRGGTVCSLVLVNSARPSARSFVPVTIRALLFTAARHRLPRHRLSPYNNIPRSLMLTVRDTFSRITYVYARLDAHYSLIPYSRREYPGLRIADRNFRRAVRFDAADSRWRAARNETFVAILSCREEEARRRTKEVGNREQERKPNRKSPIRRWNNWQNRDKSGIPGATELGNCLLKNRNDVNPSSLDPRASSVCATGNSGK